MFLTVIFVLHMYIWVRKIFNTVHYMIEKAFVVTGEMRKQVISLYVPLRTGSEIPSLIKTSQSRWVTKAEDTGQEFLGVQNLQLHALLFALVVLFRLEPCSPKGFSLLEPLALQSHSGTAAMQSSCYDAEKG